MDVNLIPSSVLDLPSSQRVDAIVHDGTTDLRLWPGPGVDRVLLEHYGPELHSVLERERERLEGGELPIGSMLRLHRGKLHCDFLLWVATRPPEKAGIAAPAPSAEIVKQAVRSALMFVSERHVARVAFGPLGAGPSALDETQRIVLISRAANEYYDECFKSGRPTGIEEVLVCHPHAQRITQARRDLGRAVKVVEAQLPASRAAEAAPARKKRASGTSTAVRKTSSKKSKPILQEADIARARATAGPYDRGLRYGVGDYFVHSKFGVGRVEELTSEGFIVVLFESGESKRLLHSRP